MAISNESKIAVAEKSKVLNIRMIVPMLKPKRLLR